VASQGPRGQYDEISLAGEKKSIKKNQFTSEEAVIVPTKEPE
jgi:hypothetical protein